MPRQARVAVGDVVYHVVNRANGRNQIFNAGVDYQHFEKLSIIRYSVNKGKPYGADTWTDSMIDRFNLSHTTRGVGRPRV
jgi:hypothetical protein